MAVSRAMRRLLRVLEIEEEQCKLALEAALGELHRLEHALVAAQERERGGRRLVALSVLQDALEDRLAGLEESRTANRHAALLKPRMREQELKIAERREVFLTKRIERRQAETLIQESEAAAAIEAGRRSQQALDDWYLNQKRSTRPAEEPQAQSIPPAKA